MFERINEGRGGRNRPMFEFKDSIMYDFHKLGVGLAYRTLFGLVWRWHDAYLRGILKAGDEEVWIVDSIMNGFH